LQNKIVERVNGAKNKDLNRTNSVSSLVFSGGYFVILKLFQMRGVAFLSGRSALQTQEKNIQVILL
jgi:hypothetical protein